MAQFDVYRLAGGELAIVVVTQFIIAVDRAALGMPVGNAAASYDRLKDAYDMLFNGI